VSDCLAGSWAEDERKKRSINEMFGDDSNDEDEEEDIRPGRRPAFPPARATAVSLQYLPLMFFLQSPRAPPPPTPLGACTVVGGACLRTMWI